MACNRCFYKSNEKGVTYSHYIDIDLLVNTGVVNFDSQFCTCLNYHKSLEKQQQQQQQKKHLSCQAVANNLFLEEVPKDVSILNTLQKEIICYHILMV